MKAIHKAVVLGALALSLIPLAAQAGDATRAREARGDAPRVQAARPGLDTAAVERARARRALAHGERGTLTPAACKALYRHDRELMVFCLESALD